MNRLLLLLICLSALSARAQQLPVTSTESPKPAQFTGIPSDTIATADGRQPKDISEYLRTIFDSSTPGDKFSIPVEGGRLKGVVKMKVTKNPIITFMYLRISNYNGASMNLTRKRLNDDQVIYYGTVHHPGYSDGLMLTHSQNKYYFISVPQSNIITD